MALGYEGKLYILAFDHRGSFQKKMFGIEGDPTPEQTETISDAKRLIFEGMLLAVERGAEALWLRDRREVASIPRLNVVAFRRGNFASSASRQISCARAIDCPIDFDLVDVDRLAPLVLHPAGAHVR